MDRVHEPSRSFPLGAPYLSFPSPPRRLPFRSAPKRTRDGEGTAEGDGGDGVVRGAAAEAGGGEQAQARGAPAAPPLRRLERGRRQALAGGSSSPVSFFNFGPVVAPSQYELSVISEAIARPVSAFRPISFVFIAPAKGS